MKTGFNGRFLYKSVHFDEKMHTTFLLVCMIICPTSLILSTIILPELMYFIFLVTAFGILLQSLSLWQDNQSIIELYENNFRMFSYRKGSAMLLSKRRLENDIDSFTNADSMSHGEWCGRNFYDYTSIVRIVPWVFTMGPVWGLRIILTNKKGHLQGNDIDLECGEDAQNVVRILHEKLQGSWSSVYQHRVVGYGCDSDIGKHVMERFNEIIEGCNDKILEVGDHQKL